MCYLAHSQGFPELESCVIPEISTEGEKSEKETEIRANDPENKLFLVNSLDEKVRPAVSHPDKSACQDHLPLTPIPRYLLRTKPNRGQHLKCCKRQSELNSQQQAQRGKKKKSLTTEQNALMNKHSWLRQRSNSRKQERVIAGHNNNTPDTAHRKSSDTVSGRLICQLLCLFEKCCQPSLAFNFTQAPI